MPTDTPCHICNTSEPLIIIEDYHALRRVSSDCKPIPRGGDLAVCPVCGTVQAVTSETWHKEIKEIYEAYTIYHQSGGVEQSVFSPSGQSTTRSTVLFDILAKHHDLSKPGRLLDIGCGNGSFLEAFSSKQSGWSLAGTEYGEHNKEKIEAIPGVEQLYVGGLDVVPGTFDVVSMIHLLEHIPDPLPFLREVHAKLNPGSTIFIELPYYGDNPFELLIADHCTHYDPESIVWVLAQAGFRTLEVSTTYVAKELSILAQASEEPIETPKLDPTRVEAVSQRVAWLKKVLNKATELKTSTSSFGIFGTSIGATWLDAELSETTAYFVDEDPSRKGREHMGRPILTPAEVPGDSLTFIPLPAPISKAVSERLSPNCPGRWEAAPAFP